MNYLSAVEKPFRSMDTQFQYYFRRFWQTHLSATTGEVTTRMGGCRLQVESNYVLEGCTGIGYGGKQLETKDNYVLEGYTGIGSEGQIHIGTIHRYRI